jgi:hypothetical protein
MRKLNSNPNVINSDPNYPNGRIRNNTGSGNGTPVDEKVYGDIHSNKDKLMDLYGINPNDLPDNETNGYQIIESLRALASKNDFILPLSLSSGIISVPIKLGFMLVNEQVVCKAGFDLSSETQIKGYDNTIYNVTFQGMFKTNEYVRLIKTSFGITLVRLADDISLDDMVGNLSYLKKANQTQENTGTTDTVATTPLTNLMAFTRRVIGTDSSNFLASSSRNGLYPIAHFNKVQNLNTPLNVGWFSGLNISATSGSLTVGGDVVSAVCQAVSDGYGVLITVANSMPNTNYKVRLDVESLGTSVLNDINAGCPMYKKISNNSFYFIIAEFSPATQNLKVFIEMINQ